MIPGPPHWPPVARQPYTPSYSLDPADGHPPPGASGPPEEIHTSVLSPSVVPVFGAARRLSLGFTFVLFAPFFFFSFNEPATTHTLPLPRPLPPPAPARAPRPGRASPPYGSGPDAEGPGGPGRSGP